MIIIDAPLTNPASFASIGLSIYKYLKKFGFNVCYSPWTLDYPVNRDVEINICRLASRNDVYIRVSHIDSFNVIPPCKLRIGIGPIDIAFNNLNYLRSCILNTHYSFTFCRAYVDKMCKVFNVNNVYFMPLGFDPDYFNDFNKDKIKKMYGLHGRYVIGMVTRFDRRENPTTLISALQLAKIKNKLNLNNVSVVFISNEIFDPNYFEEVIKQLKSLSVHYRIYVGVKDFVEYSNLIKLLDVLVICSTYESGTSLIPEAIASRTVPIVTNQVSLVEYVYDMCGCINDIIIESTDSDVLARVGNTVVDVKIPNTSDLAQKICKLNSEDLRQEILSKCLSKVNEYSYENIVKKYLVSIIEKS